VVGLIGLTWPELESGGGGATPVVHWLTSAPQVMSATSAHTLRED